MQPTPARSTSGTGRAPARVLATILATLVLAAGAGAADYYVDAATGSDANSGTSPLDAWKTVSHAVATVGRPAAGASDTIHVAAGVYDPALGESFGFALSMRVALVGAGRDVTILDGASLSGPMILEDGDGTSSALPPARIEGLTLRRADTGIRVFPNDGEDFGLALRDVRIADMTGWGLTAFRGGFQDALFVSFDDVRIESCGAGAWFDDFGDHGTMQVEIRDSAIVGSSGPGINCLQGYSCIDDLIVEDTRIEGHFGPAVRLASASGCCLDVVLRRCTIVGNGDAVAAVASTLPAGASALLERCTIAGNAGAGVLTTGGGSSFSVSLDSCIVYGNGDDFADTLGLVSGVSYCDIGDGDYVGSNQNISADPLFVDSSGGDFGLLAGSPCIDAGDPALGVDRDCTTQEMGAAFHDQGAPFVYCAGKLSSQSCVPYVCGTGTPSASGTEPFVLRAEDALAGQAGLLIYGFAKANLDFHGGKLCVKAPQVRLLPPKLAKDAGVPPCTGVLRRDFNRRIQGGTDPMLTGGQTVFAQWLQRDPSDPAGYGDSLSDAARFTIGP